MSSIDGVYSSGSASIIQYEIRDPVERNNSAS